MCAPPAAANVSPLSGLRGEALAAAAAAQLEDLAASCQPLKEAYSYSGGAYSSYARAPTPALALDAASAQEQLAAVQAAMQTVGVRA